MAKTMGDHFNDHFNVWDHCSSHCFVRRLLPFGFISYCFFLRLSSSYSLIYSIFVRNDEREPYLISNIHTLAKECSSGDDDDGRATSFRCIIDFMKTKTNGYSVLDFVFLFRLIDNNEKIKTTAKLNAVFCSDCY